MTLASPAMHVRSNRGKIRGSAHRAPDDRNAASPLALVRSQGPGTGCGRPGQGEGALSGVETPESDPDRALVERAQAELPYGTTAYNELVRRHTARVYGRAQRILRSSADAEEATQDVFLSVFRNLPRFRFEKPFVHWLNTVTLNACRMVLRRRAAEQRRRAAYRDQAPPPPERPDPPDAGLRKLVTELLDTLDPGTRVPMIMRFVEGYSFPEIAEQLEISESAAKMRIARGSKKLRELYEERVRGEKRLVDAKD